MEIEEPSGSVVRKSLEGWVNGSDRKKICRLPHEVANRKHFDLPAFVRKGEITKNDNFSGRWVQESIFRESDSKDS